MELADYDDYEQPNIDWECKQCGEVYRSTGYPPETRCMSGHAAGWKPEQDKIDRDIELLESLTPVKGVVIVGEGPAPLKGPVKEVNEQSVTIASLESPARKVRWDDEKIEWANLDRDVIFWNDVYHVEIAPQHKDD
jgi:hypothetical protein